MKLIKKLFFPVFMLLLSFQNSHSQQNLNGWYWANSQPQSNDLNWVQIVSTSNYFAVGLNGTFMKSTDAGENWIINSQAGVRDEVIEYGNTLTLFTGWFFDANTGIVAGQSNFGDGGKIKRTTDGGMTFSTINLGLPTGLARVTDIHFINSLTGFLCGNNNVNAMKTTDGGSTWNALPNLAVANLSYNSIYAVDESNIFLGSESNGKIMRSIDGGNTWIQYSIPVTNSLTITDIEFVNSSTGFLSGNPNYFAYTTNSGVNWVQVSLPDISNPISDLKIVGSTVYALGQSGNYYSSSDLGANWETVDFDDPTNIHQPNSNTVYSFDFYQNEVIVVGVNGKINASLDNGATWRNKNYSVGNNELTFPSVFALPGTDNVWAGGSGGVILTSTNNGSNWYEYQTSALYSFNDIEMSNANTGYAAGGFFVAGVGYCYKTINGGTSWEPLSLPVTSTPVTGLSFVDQNTGWIFGGYAISFQPGLIFKTTNGGTNWTSQSVTPSDNSMINDGDMVDANTGYCFSSSRIWKTTNGGSNWDRIMNLPENANWNSIKTFSGSTVYAGGSNVIYKSTNGGASWQIVNFPNSNDPVFKTDWIDQNNGIAVGVMGYTAKTSDGGATWTERNTGSSTLTGVSMKSKDVVYASSDRNVYGAIFKLTDVISSINSGISGIEGIPTNFELSQNYPNPFNPTTQIDFNIPFDGKVNLSIFDMTGREVATIINEVKTAGSYSVNFNGYELTSGTYFYRIIAEGKGQNFTSTKKMTLLK